MATLANTYQLVDPPAAGLNSNTVNGAGSGGTGKPFGEPFIASSAANAYTVAYLASSVFQRPFLLVSLAAPTPYTLVVGVAPTVGLTQVPSGVTY